MSKSKIRPGADPNSLQERQALERRLTGVQQAHAAARTRGDTLAVERYERLIAAMTQCLADGTQFYSLHRHRRSTEGHEP